MARRSRGQRRRHAARQRKEHNPRRTATFDQSSSSLMSLPAELRNRIWSIVFEGSIQQLRNTTAADPKVITRIHTIPPPSLLTCKKVYGEALGIYYSSTIFVNPLSGGIVSSAKLTREWMDSIGLERARLIQDIRLQVCRHWSDVIDLDDDDLNWDRVNRIPDDELTLWKVRKNVLTVEGAHTPLVETDLRYYWFGGDFTIWAFDLRDADLEVLTAYGKLGRVMRRVSWRIFPDSAYSVELKQEKEAFEQWLKDRV